ncbi:hypothetical protein DYB38_003794 [Aphanomyces astaci]|uniref:Uncharacterized protein n=1 Tax=Aphanomyces astaci TaxID=112090 RepID=A0A397D0I1_APHAT|nr:hypothetical protein DYB38_003794 [Aphanomyces astaci]
MNGADINATDSNGHTAAHQAARNGRVQVLEVLHALGADLNKCSLRGVSIAHQAAFGGHLVFLKRLMDFDVRVDLVDASDLTPLEVAMREKQWHVVEFLECIYSRLELLPQPAAVASTLDQELMTMLGAAPLEFPSSPSAVHHDSHDDSNNEAEQDDLHRHCSADEMHTSSLRLHSLLSFSQDGDVEEKSTSPHATYGRRKRSATAAALDDDDFPTTPVHEPPSSTDVDVSWPHHPRSSYSSHMMSLPPIASPSSWKTMPLNPTRSNAVSWRGSKHDSRSPETQSGDASEDQLVDNNEEPIVSGLVTVYHLLYDM